MESNFESHHGHDGDVWLVASADNNTTLGCWETVEAQWQWPAASATVGKLFEWWATMEQIDGVFWKPTSLEENYITGYVENKSKVRIKRVFEASTVFNPFLK